VRSMRSVLRYIPDNRLQHFFLHCALHHTLLSLKIEISTGLECSEVTRQSNSLWHNNRVNR
jgi:hypothetical protein